MKIAILYGGYSEEFEISRKSALNISQNFPKSHEGFLVELSKDEKFRVHQNGNFLPIDLNDFSFLLNGEKQRFDAVFPVVHGTPIEDGRLQGYFEMLGLPYIGCDGGVSALTFNKFQAKKSLEEMAIKSPRGKIFLKAEDRGRAKEVIENEMGMPCFVKPNSGGSSVGISKVSKAEDILEALEKSFSVTDTTIVEEALDGIEVTSGVYFSHQQQKVVSLPLTEISTPNDFFDYNAKYLGESDEITPARIDDHLTKKIQKISEQIFQFFGAGGFARIDYIIKNEEPYFM